MVRVVGCSSHPLAEKAANLSGIHNRAIKRGVQVFTQTSHLALVVNPFLSEGRDGRCTFLRFGIGQRSCCVSGPGAQPRVPWLRASRDSSLRAGPSLLSVHCVFLRGTAGVLSFVGSESVNAAALRAGPTALRSLRLSSGDGRCTFLFRFGIGQRSCCVSGPGAQPRVRWLRALRDTSLRAGPSLLSVHCVSCGFLAPSHVGFGVGAR